MEDIAFYEQTWIKDPLEKRGIDQNLWIWEPADYSRNYLITADVARGDGKDSSAFHIWDVETFTQVGEYRGQVGTKDYGHLLASIATEYNNAKDDKRIHGLFISHKYRMEAKEESSLGIYLNQSADSDLHNVKMLVSNEEKATKITNDNLERLKKAGDRIAYLKEKMYYPQEVDDIFLNEDTNIFDIESAKRQKTRLLQQEKTGTPVVLFNDGEKIAHEFTDKMPISNFPLKNSDLKEAPVVIYEFPVDNPPYGLYVAGVDPYRQGKSAYSTSLGSVYIYKRMHEISGEKYQDMFVASYCARPDKKETWEEQARLLIKYYNARALCENDDISFIEYMKAKGDAHYLEKSAKYIGYKLVVPAEPVVACDGLSRYLFITTSKPNI